MTAEKIDEQLHRQPFEPFRIHMSDGSSYEVRHPEFALFDQERSHCRGTATDGQVSDPNGYM